MTEGEGGNFRSKLRDVIFECPLNVQGHSIMTPQQNGVAMNMKQQKHHPQKEWERIIISIHRQCLFEHRSTPILEHSNEQVAKHRSAT